MEDILKTPKTGKAAGPDSIDNRLLKELARPLSFPLTDLFIFSLSKGKSQVSGNKQMLLLFSTRIPRRAVSHLPLGGGAQVQHQLQQWAKYWYSIVWDVLTQSIYKG